MPCRSYGANAAEAAEAAERWHTGGVSPTLRTTCAGCGTVEIAVAAAVLRLSLHDEDSRNIVEYTCPRCGRPGSQRVGERGTRLLSRAGVTLVAPVAAVTPAVDGTPDGADLHTVD